MSIVICSACEGKPSNQQCQIDLTRLRAALVFDTSVAQLPPFWAELLAHIASFRGGKLTPAALSQIRWRISDALPLTQGLVSVPLATAARICTSAVDSAILLADGPVQSTFEGCQIGLGDGSIAAAAAGSSSITSSVASLTSTLASLTLSAAVTVGKTVGTGLLGLGTSIAVAAGLAHAEDALQGFGAADGAGEVDLPPGPLWHVATWDSWADDVRGRLPASGPGQGTWRAMLLQHPPHVPIDTSSVEVGQFVSFPQFLAAQGPSCAQFVSRVTSAPSLTDPGLDLVRWLAYRGVAYTVASQAYGDILVVRGRDIQEAVSSAPSALSSPPRLARAPSFMSPSTRASLVGLGQGSPARPSPQDVAVAVSPVLLRVQSFSLERCASSGRALIGQLQEQARARLKAGDKDGARAMVQRYKAEEARIAAAEAKLIDITAARHALEDAHESIAQTHALATATHTLRHVRISSGLTADSAQDVLDDLREALDEAQDVQDVLGQGVGVGNVDVESELASLLGERQQDVAAGPAQVTPVRVAGTGAAAVTAPAFPQPQWAEIPTGVPVLPVGTAAGTTVPEAVAI